MPGLLKYPKLNNIFWYAPGILVGLYILIRCFTVGATYDEVWTFQDYVTDPISEVLNCYECDANNHLLNTIAIKIAWVFSNELWISRIPNFLAGLLYIIFSYGICQRFFSGPLRWILLILFLSNPFLLDFFSLARGYGLALGFIQASLYFLLCYHRSNTLSSVIFSLSFAALAVISNFSTLLYYCALLAIIFFHSLIFTKRILGPLLSIGVVSSALAYLIYPTINKLISHEKLYFGGHSGIYYDTLKTLLRNTLYNNHQDYHPFLLLNILLVFAACLLMLKLISLFRTGHKERYFCVMFIILIPPAISLIQHHWMGTAFLIGRTALFYIPLFILCLGLWARLPSRGLSTFSHISLALLAVFSLGNFFHHANFYKSLTWDFDSRVPDIVKYLEDKQAEDREKIEIAGAWPFQMSFPYYLEKNSSPKIVYDLSQTYADTIKADYFLLMGRDMDVVGYNHRHWLPKQAYDTVLSFPDEQVYLFEMKDDPEKKLAQISSP